MGSGLNIPIPPFLFTDGQRVFTLESDPGSQARGDSPIEMRGGAGIAPINPSPIFSQFQQLNPGSTVNETAVASFAFDAGGFGDWKVGSLSWKWSAATANNPIGVMRLNAAGAVAGVASDYVFLRGFYKNGAVFFGVNDIDNLGLNILWVRGTQVLDGLTGTVTQILKGVDADYTAQESRAGILGGIVRNTVADFSGAKLFQINTNFTGNEQVWESDTNEIAKIHQNGTTEWDQLATYDVGVKMAPGALLYVDTEAATGAAGVADLDAQSGTITTEALITAGGAVTTYRVNNARVTHLSTVFPVIRSGGTNTTGPIIATNTAVFDGYFTVDIVNLNALTALNGTIMFDFLVMRSS
jgi:hypothetical protein